MKNVIVSTIILLAGSLVSLAQEKSRFISAYTDGDKFNASILYSNNVAQVVAFYLQLNVAGENYEMPLETVLATGKVQVLDDIKKGQYAQEFNGEGLVVRLNPLPISQMVQYLGSNWDMSFKVLAIPQGGVVPEEQVLHTLKVNLNNGIYEVSHDLINKNLVKLQLTNSPADIFKGVFNGEVVILNGELPNLAATGAPTTPTTTTPPVVAPPVVTPPVVTPPVVAPPVTELPNNVPSAPTDSTPTRSVTLFTQDEVNNLIKEATHNLFTAEQVSEAEHKAADLAFEEGVSAVKSRPEHYGVNTASVMGTTPFVKGWVYAESGGWIYIDSLFPFVYVENAKSWVLIQEKEGALAYFVYNLQSWLTYEELSKL